MRLGALVSFVALTLLGLSTSARAQVADEGFCRMLSGVGDQGLARVGDVVSGTTGRSGVRFDRSVDGDEPYLFVVALSTAATAASVMPLERVGDEAPRREALRIAHDFTARSGGTITLSFEAPPGTAYHAALYRITRQTPGLGMRPSALALGSAGGTGDLSDGAPHPPDCRPSLPPHLRGRSPNGARPTVRIGRAEIHGSMPRAEVERVLEGNRAALSYCAQTHGAAAVRLRLVIAPTGLVVSASADGDRPALCGCVTRMTRRWRFPHTGAGITSIEVVLSFD